MSKEISDGNQQPGESNDEKSSSLPSGQGQDNAGQSNPTQPGAPQSGGPASPPAVPPNVPSPSVPSGAPANYKPNFILPKPPAAGQAWSVGTGQSIPNLPPHFRELVEKAAGTVVARTKLDHDVLKGVVRRTVADKEVKVAELRMAQAAIPPKPFLPIENYRKASPCSASWGNTESQEKVRFCEQCKCQVYDFTGMELPEAEGLIFMRENRRNAPLFKRQDGKFLTGDCPVGVKRKRDLILATVGGSLMVLLLLAALLSVPKPVPAPNSQRKDVQAEATQSVENLSTQSKDAANSQTVRSESGPPTIRSLDSKKFRTPFGETQPQVGPFQSDYQQQQEGYQQQSGVSVTAGSAQQPPGASTTTETYQNHQPGAGTTLGTSQQQPNAGTTAGPSQQQPSAGTTAGTSQQQPSAGAAPTNGVQYYGSQPH